MPASEFDFMETLSNNAVTVEDPNEEESFTINIPNASETEADELSNKETNDSENTTTSDEVSGSVSEEEQSSSTELEEQSSDAESTNKPSSTNSTPVINEIPPHIMRQMSQDLGLSRYEYNDAPRYYNDPNKPQQAKGGRFPAKPEPRVKDKDFNFDGVISHEGVLEIVSEIFQERKDSNPNVWVRSANATTVPLYHCATSSHISNRDSFT